MAGALQRKTLPMQERLPKPWGWHSTLETSPQNTGKTYALNQDQLRRARFPLGELTKEAVRAMAKQANLPVAAKKDSTGICFIGERNFDAFVDNYLQAIPGPIYAVDGTLIGEHSGLIHYTLGQRKGLSIGGLRNYPEAPWFVAHKDLERNALYVCQASNDPTLMADQLWAQQVHWISGVAPTDTAKLTAKIRYRQSDQPCSLTLLDDNSVFVQFDHHQRAVTPGQSIVFYQGEVCLGGAVIERSNATLPRGLASPV
jgi:tRNA-specific 2-thiouridylase